ncbi:unnamed protein product [Enterobius vermicularis]|uniref:P-type phospholipid transporter n=1 Tax=Enterobius vermicularis TaxID=51028 RepID=A0A0N4UXU5_ENTVE|nr:unnamed protein product [Enterobius vermicularis]
MLDTITLHSNFKAEPKYQKEYIAVYAAALHDFKVTSVGTEQVLLRGTRLVNTSWIFGVALYTGKETKLLMNSAARPLKKAKIGKTKNCGIAILVVALAGLLAFSFYGAELYENFFLLKSQYLGPSSLAAYFALEYRTLLLVFILQRYTCIIDNNARNSSIYSSFLYRLCAYHTSFNSFTITLVFHESALAPDLEIYDEDSDTPAVARTSNLNEELGQVNFVLCDKTGTMTESKTKLKRWFVDGKDYDSGDKGSYQIFIEKLSKSCCPEESDENVPREFLRSLVLCNSAVPTTEESDQIVYRGPFPEEIALVIKARSMNFTLQSRTSKSVEVNELGETIKYQILNVLGFTSERMRMSVVVRCFDNAIRVYTKGADSAVIKRLQPNPEVQNKCHSQLKDYANMGKSIVELFYFSCADLSTSFLPSVHKIIGYHTLCFAYRTLEENFYKKWAKKYQEATDKELDDCTDDIEKDMSLIGVAALEDKLQKGVAKTIQSLFNAKIRVWMITGDMVETALSCARLSGFCTSTTEVLSLNSVRQIDPLLHQSLDLLPPARFSKLNVARFFLFKFRVRFFSCCRFLRRRRVAKNPKKEFILTVEGKTLQSALEKPYKKHFFHLSLMCRSVICCRMTPTLKAGIVKMVQNKGKNVVLAVGDGANDVAMIQQADVGVAIAGEEGLRAAFASDYSIAQFRFLRRLLFVHGAWNFKRTSRVILYCFYKSICFYLIEMWFAFFSAFSCQSVFDNLSVILFNLFFTALPPIMIGIFDKPADCKFADPMEYIALRKKAFTITSFVKRLVLAAWHSFILFSSTYIFLYNPVVWSNGRTGGRLMFGNSCYTFLLITVSLKALLDCESWALLIVFSSAISILFWFLFILLYSSRSVLRFVIFTQQLFAFEIWPNIKWGAEMCGVASIMFSSPSFWLACALVPIVTLFFDFIWKA